MCFSVIFMVYCVRFERYNICLLYTSFYRFNDPFPDKTLYNLHILSVDGTGVTVPMDRINENKKYARVPVSYTHLDVYKRQ